MMFEIFCFVILILFLFYDLLRLVKYLPHNRNIQRIRDLDHKCNQMKTGKLSVVSFLSELPATEHDPQSFAVDLAVFTVSSTDQIIYLLFQIISSGDLQENISISNSFATISFENQLKLIINSLPNISTARPYSTHRDWNFPGKNKKPCSRLIIVPFGKVQRTAHAVVPAIASDRTIRQWFLHYK